LHRRKKKNQKLVIPKQVKGRGRVEGRRHLRAKKKYVFARGGGQTEKKKAVGGANYQKKKFLLRKGGRRKGGIKKKTKQGEGGVTFRKGVKRKTTPSSEHKERGKGFQKKNKAGGAVKKPRPC